MSATFLTKVNSTALLIVVIALAGSPAGQAQRALNRRGGPHDWSHSHIVGSAEGTAQDGRFSTEWRVVSKHRRLNQARDMRDPMIDWFRDFTRDRRPPPPDKGAKLDWSLRTGGFGSVLGYPAKYSFDITASSCSDVLYFTVNQAGGASTVNVIAITNPYAGCAGNAAGLTPTVKFGLSLPNGTATSAVPSLDGTILYVVESRSSAGGGPILHAILVNNITTTPGTYDFGTTNWTSVHTLAAPTGTPTSEQLFQLTFAGINNDVSSPFLDYLNNVLYFGDSLGRVHRIINAGSTTAAEGPNFPVACGTAELVSPALGNGQLVAASADGRFYRIDTNVAGPYTCIQQAQAGAGTSVAGGLAAPLIDVSNNKIIKITNDASGAIGKWIGIINLTFATGEASVSSTTLGQADTNAPVTPALDNLFWNTNNGFIYANGSPTAGGNTYLMRIPYNGSAVSAPVGYALLPKSGGASAAVQTSPVTEFLTASSLANPDFLFIGGSGANYRYMNRIASGFAGTNAAPVAMASSFAVPGGATSGIVIDTRTTAITGTTATANIYFGTVGIAGTTQSTIVQLAQQF